MLLAPRPRPARSSAIFVLACLALITARGAGPLPPVRLMAVGDSVTAGADFFSCYRYPLWEKLFAAGYVVEFVGTQTSPSRVGPLAHEGYGGKNTEYLASTVPEHFRAHPADIVLLHSGHNHSVEEQPVPGIVAATERLIAALRRINPRVTVLLAQVIPAGKLPKYAYLGELNTALADLAARLDSADQRVMIVDHATGFDWRTDTVADRVHPNAAGAEKMATAWFRALQTVLPPPERSFTPRLQHYETDGGLRLALHVFEPAPASGAPPPGGRPVIVFFFGGGWTHGTPVQFYAECAHFADRGYVAISADYRIASTHGATPFDSVADARAALRWIRTHARELGIDPSRVIAAGASAGGHLAAVAALAPESAAAAPDTPLAAISARPDALLLWYPVLDTSPAGHGYDRFGERYAAFSPLHLLESAPDRLPPTLLLVGSADPLAPVSTARAFRDRARTAVRPCELVVYPGAGHPLYAYRTGGGPLRDATLAAADAFLASLPAIERGN